jgi:hypothetical protein
MRIDPANQDPTITSRSASPIGKNRLILAHRPPGIVGTYNLHEFQDEKAEALEAWAQRLNSIVSPPAKVPDKKIVPLRKRRR